MKDVFIHKTAEISPDAEIGIDTKIWNQAQVRENAKIGKNCTISKNVYIDTTVEIGDNVKIQNNSSIYKGANIENNVFIGPHTCITNDKNPRAITPDGSPKTEKDWRIGETRIKEGASIGAGSIILPDVTIGKFALVGAGSIVSKDVPDHALVFGNPAKIKGYVCFCGKKLDEENYCQSCKQTLKINKTQ